MPARSDAPPSRIVIYRLGSLGDTVCALPCFHAIERAFPDAERLVLTNVPVSSKAAALEIVLGESGLIHGAIPYPLSTRDPRTLFSLARQLRGLGTDTLVYLAAARGRRTAQRDVAFFRTAGFRRIIGAPLSDDLQRNRISADGELERESSRLARTMAPLSAIDLSDRSWWDLRLSERERTAGLQALGGLADQPFLAVNTGGKAAEKDWGTANWADLLGRLAEQAPGLGLVFVGAREDSERAAELGAGWNAGPVLDLCGTVSPRESAAALERATLFVGHDSGPLHLADAAGAPAIGLFGDFNEPKMWHPSGSTTHMIHHMAGLHTIRAEHVVALATPYLAGAEAARRR